MNTNLNILAPVAKYELMSQIFALIYTYVSAHVFWQKCVSKNILRNSKQLVGGFNPSEKY